LENWRSKKCKGIIYLCTSKTEGKSYIGLTRRPFKTRVDGHKKDADAGKGSENSIQEAIRLYGIDDISFQQIDTAKTLGDLADKERQYITEYGTLKPRGYNHNRGGSVSTGGEVFEFLGDVYFSLADIADHYRIYEETVRKRIHAGWNMSQAVELEDPPEIERVGDHWNFDEYEFNSTAKLCEFFEINVSTFKYRINAGWTVQESCGLIEKDKKTYFYNGKEYDSIKKMAEENNQNYERVSSRLSSGLTLKEAMNSEENPARFGRKAIKIDGINYPSKTEAAKALGLTTNKLNLRLEYTNEDRNEAKLIELKVYDWEKKDRDLTVERITYNSFSELSKVYKVNENTIRHRLNAGKSIEFAVGLEVEDTIFPLEFYGKIFKTYTEIAEHYGVKLKTFTYRFNKANWTLEESLGLVEKAHQIETHIVGGIEFPSLSAISRHYNIPKATFDSRLQRNWSLEEACNLKQRNEIQAKRRVYMITHPDGVQECVTNLAEFGRQYDLPNVYNLSTTINNKVHHSYKGFQARYASEDEIAELLSKDPPALASKANYNRNHEVTYKRKKYRSKNKLCSDLGIRASMLRRQLNLGKSLNKAIEYCLKKKKY
jgi:hypothetical protein